MLCLPDTNNSQNATDIYVVQRKCACTVDTLYVCTSPHLSFADYSNFCLHSFPEFHQSRVFNAAESL